MIHCLQNGPRVNPDTASGCCKPDNLDDRRKLPMPPKRKLLQTALPQGDEAVAAIYAVIRRIPKGWVATYGQVAAIIIIIIVAVSLIDVLSQALRSRLL